MSPSIHGFIQTWKNSAGNERANKDSFLRELCEALEIQVPGPKDQLSEYCFEKDLRITHLDGSTSTGSIDLFKAGCFVLEANQGNTKEKKGPSPVREVCDLEERRDAHRNAAQARGLAITGVCNLLQELRKGEPFTLKEREQHSNAQTEILSQLHDELDQAVLDSDGWPADIQDAEILERLVALNQERAAEEARGLVRWLRPNHQCRQAVQPEARPIIGLETEPEEKPVVPSPAIVSQAWPKDLKDQLAALRGLLLASDHLWTLEEVGAAFKSRGRYRESIQAHLGLLADLGVVEVLVTGDGIRFHRPQAVGA